MTAPTYISTTTTVRDPYHRWNPMRLLFKDPDVKVGTRRLVDEGRPGLYDWFEWALLRVRSEGFTDQTRTLMGSAMVVFLMYAVYLILLQMVSGLTSVRVGCTTIYQYAKVASVVAKEAEQEALDIIETRQATRRRTRSRSPLLIEDVRREQATVTAIANETQTSAVAKRAWTLARVHDSTSRSQRGWDTPE